MLWRGKGNLLPGGGGGRWRRRAGGRGGGGGARWGRCGGPRPARRRGQTSQGKGLNSRGGERPPPPSNKKKNPRAREPRRRAHVLFATLSFNIAAFCLISFFAKRFESPFFGWLALVVAVSLPATAQRFFQAFLGDEAGPPPLSRTTVVGAGVLYTVLF